MKVQIFIELISFVEERGIEFFITIKELVGNVNKVVMFYLHDRIEKKTVMVRGNTQILTAKQIVNSFEDYFQARCTLVFEVPLKFFINLNKASETEYGACGGN